MATTLTAPGEEAGRELDVSTTDRLEKRERFAYLDALKVALIVLVIAHHAGQSFGPTGGAWPVYNDERAPILDKFFTVNAAFFMGLFFLISAYFLPASFEQKGPSRYLRERFVRLGTPIAVLFGGGLLYAAVQIVIFQGGSVWTAVQHTWSSIVIDQHLQHFWFLDQLLIYSVVYVVWRMVTARRSSTEPLAVPGNSVIFAFTLALALVTFLVMVEYPMNRWIVLFGILTTEPAHLPQYASLFLVGLLAYQGRWLTRMSTRQGMLWLGIGLALSALWCVRPFGATGGFSVDTLMRSTWEAFECVGLCVGLLVLFREVVSSLPRLLQIMAPSAYGVYIIHVYLVVPLQVAVIGLAAPPLVKFALVVLLAAPISFALAALLRHLPVLRAVL
jgi:surface polysaccharide O-acyltransferase-like enzyme